MAAEVAVDAFELETSRIAADAGRAFQHLDRGLAAFGEHQRGTDTGRAGAKDDYRRSHECSIVSFAGAGRCSWTRKPMSPLT